MPVVGAWWRPPSRVSPWWRPPERTTGSGLSMWSAGRSRRPSCGPISSFPRDTGLSTRPRWLAGWPPTSPATCNRSRHRPRQFNLPTAAGLSSSSAFVVAIILALAKVNSLEQRIEYRRWSTPPRSSPAIWAPSRTARALVKIWRDHAGVGTLGGSEDHTAILCSRRAAELRPVQLCPGASRARIPHAGGPPLCHCRQRRRRFEKTGGAREQYNRLSTLAAEITAIWRRGHGTTRARHLAAALAEAGGSPDELRAVLTAAGDHSLRHELLAALRALPRESDDLLPVGGE